jgi:hypothetical protein
MLGLAPGLPHGELQNQVAKLGGKLSCKPSTVDRRFTECTASLSQAPDGRRWELRASLVDGGSAVTLLKTTASAKAVEALRAELIDTYGRPNYRQQGSQTSYEWIRAGRMMRLTSRPQRDLVEVSVSLVDGPALDALSSG